MWATANEALKKYESRFDTATQDMGMNLKRAAENALSEAIDSSGGDTTGAMPQLK
jgi:hypothetical protein